MIVVTTLTIVAAASTAAADRSDELTVSCCFLSPLSVELSGLPGTAMGCSLEADARRSCSSSRAVSQQFHICSTVRGRLCHT